MVNNKKPFNILKKEEIVRILFTANNNGLYLDNLITNTLLNTGIRLGELLALKWEDLDSNKHTLRIRQILYPKANSSDYRILPNRSERTIIIDDSLIKLMDRHKTAQEQLKAKHPLLYENNDFIFAMEDGHPISVTAVKKRLSRLAALVEIENPITPSTLRNTFIYNYFKDGLPLKYLQIYLGHKNINSTVQLYSNLYNK